MDRATVLLILLLILFVILLVVLSRYFSLKEQVRDLARQQFQQWLEREAQEIRRQSLEQARREMEMELREREERIRKEAVQQSQAVTRGRVIEQFAPYLPQFTYSPMDAHFIGNPIDFIVFDGLADGEVREVVFVEVKTGTTGLNPHQRLVRKAIQEHRVRWQEMRFRGASSAAASEEGPTQAPTEPSA